MLSIVSKPGKRVVIYISVRDNNFATVSMIFQLDFQTVLTVWYLCFHFIDISIMCDLARKRKYELLSFPSMCPMVFVLLYISESK